MPKIKVPRKDISLDMTAMCDVAFLLLTFFMLATKFKPEQKAVVDIPSSMSEIKVPDNDLIVISVQKDSAIFFTVDGQHTRAQVLTRMAEKYSLPLTDENIKEFSLMEEIGIPLKGLKSYLEMTPEKRKKVVYEGIPVGVNNNELSDWIATARQVNRKCRIAVKGDKDVPYPVIERVIATLQEQNINKFNLITTLEK